jgi:site-specific recombinase XerC
MGEHLKHLSSSFARHLRAEGKAEASTVIYGQSVAFFGRWQVNQGLDPVLEELTRAAVRKWLVQLSDWNQLSTVRTRYKGLHRFCSWLVDEGEITANPLAVLDPPVSPVKPMPILSDEQLTGAAQGVRRQGLPSAPR